jgi:hypothetical protein
MNYYIQKIHTYLSYFSTWSPPELRHFYRGIRFFMPVSSAKFWHIPSRQLLIIIEASWFQPVLQAGKQAVVARSEIRAVRRVVKQLPVEMLQQYSSASSCTVCRRALSWKSTTPDGSIPRLSFWMILRRFFSVSQYTCNVIVVPCCMNSTISSPFPSQKTVAISFLADRQRCLNFFRLVWWMCVHPLLWLLFSFNIHK